MLNYQTERKVNIYDGPAALTFNSLHSLGNENEFDHGQDRQQIFALRTYDAHTEAAISTLKLFNTKMK